MNEGREDYLTALIAIVLAGAFYPTSAVIYDAETYPETIEEIQESQEA